MSISTHSFMKTILTLSTGLTPAPSESMLIALPYPPLFPPPPPRMFRLTSWRLPAPNLPPGVLNHPVVTVNSFSITASNALAFAITVAWLGNVLSYWTRKFTVIPGPKPMSVSKFEVSAICDPIFSSFAICPDKILRRCLLCQGQKSWARAGPQPNNKLEDNRENHQNSPPGGGPHPKKKPKHQRDHHQNPAARGAPKPQ